MEKYEYISLGRLVYLGIIHQKYCVYIKLFVNILICLIIQYIINNIHT